jgi:hypothetical protein
MKNKKRRRRKHHHHHHCEIEIDEKIKGGKVKIDMKRGRRAS